MEININKEKQIQIDFTSIINSFIKIINNYKYTLINKIKGKCMHTY